MTRQRLLTGCFLLLTCIAAQSQPSPQSWNFRVYLDDSEIGTHRFTLTRSGAEQRMVSEAHFKVKLLFINAYSYDHLSNEGWREGCLTSMEARTRDGGKTSTVTAALRGGKLEVVTPKATAALAGCVMSFAYWDPRMLQQQRLLNAQSGEYDAVTIQKLGTQDRRIRGVSVTTGHYRLSSDKLRIELWYSPAGEWLALESTTDNGKRLRYELQ